MGKKIMIIDDDNRNIFALSAVLKARGFVCLSAISMNEAFSILEKESSVELILLDMMMPEMDGYKAISVLKSDDRYKPIPVIAVTAQAMAGDREKCLAAGANDYISKPVDVDRLVALLNQYLS